MYLLRADREGLLDEVEQLATGGVRMAEKEGGDGAGEPGQELACGSAVHAVMGLLDGLLGGELLLPGGVGSADAEQSGDLRHLEAGVAMEQEMTEQARRVVVTALPAAKAEDRSKQSGQLGSEPALWDVRLFQPGRQVLGCHRHGTASRAKPPSSSFYSVSAQS